MPNSDFLTAEQFLACRHELADGGRWSELASGRVTINSPPTPEHGTAVLNLGKALALYSQRERRGYACFDLGFVVGRHPDTVRFPPISYFVGGTMFAETDNVITYNRPQLVVEIASTADRRKGLDERVSEWLRWGVKLVWVLDPTARQAHSFELHRSGQRLFEEQTLIGGTALLGFAITVGDLFREPQWATGPTAAESRSKPPEDQPPLPE